MSRLTLIAASIFWMCAVTLGLGVLYHYEKTPGRGGDSPNRWPTETYLRRANDQATLVMLIHPPLPLFTSQYR